MAFKKLIIIITISILSACNANAEMAFKQHSELKLYQEYAQASCLATVFTDGEIYQQAVAALNGYREVSVMPLEAYGELSIPLKLWLQKDYLTQGEQQNNLMKCIDFASSKEVTQLYLQHDPCKVTGKYGVNEQQKKFKCPIN